jgi:hypothetical protein
MSGFDYERSPVQRIRISFTGQNIDFRLCQLDERYDFIPTDNGFAVSIDGVEDFISQIRGVQSYAIEYRGSQ